MHAVTAGTLRGPDTLWNANDMSLHSRQFPVEIQLSNCVHYVPNCHLRHIFINLLGVDNTQAG